MVDILIILFLLMSFVKGAKRGVLKELVLIIGTILIYIIAFKFKDSLGILLCKWLPFLKFGGVYALNVLFYQMIAFVIIMTILYSIFRIILKVTGFFQKVINMSIIFTIPSKILGGIIGLIEGYIVVFTVLVVSSVPFSDSALLNDSRLNTVIIDKTPILSGKTNYLTGITDDVYKLAEEKNIKSISDLNRKVLKIFAKYDIIATKDIDDIVEKGNKLDFTELIPKK